MPVYVALLRAVNVGGTGTLPMAELRGLCDALGFAGARTYLASGNVMLSSPRSDVEVASALQDGLARLMGRPVGVLVRTAQDMARVLAANPFAEEPGDEVAVLFLDAVPPPDVAEAVRGRIGEAIVAGAGEIYVHDPHGMGRSRLRLPDADRGTARNLNTVTALVALCA